MDKERIIEIVSHSMLDDDNIENSIDCIWPSDRFETAFKELFTDAIDNLLTYVLEDIEEAYDVED